MKYLLILQILIFFPGANLIAQSSNNNFKPKLKLVKEVIYSVENGELRSRDELFASELCSYTVYDKNEAPLEIGKCHAKGDSYKKTIYVRDEKGNVQKAMMKNATGDLLSYWTYEYDSNGNMIEAKAYDAENNLTKIQFNTYDENGNNTEIRVKNPSINISESNVYEYNSDNKKIKELRYKSDGSLRDTRVYTYDQNGNEDTLIKFNPDGNYIKKVYEYDTMNNLILEKSYDKEGKLKRLTSFERVYDAYGNWITNKRSSQGKLNMVYERLIEYDE
ncbi:RHS repeat domain-containing protein [Winogradskyella rapida]|uniref:RHS repeat domain-containing protein n=1 Tax=Winogradskyella rapida TaxID=549701 RepID=A0ABW3KLN4_9FLAO